MKSTLRHQSFFDRQWIKKMGDWIQKNEEPGKLLQPWHFYKEIEFEHLGKKSNRRRRGLRANNCIL